MTPQPNRRLITKRAELFEKSSALSYRQLGLKQSLAEIWIHLAAVAATKSATTPTRSAARSTRTSRIRTARRALEGLQRVIDDKEELGLRLIAEPVRDSHRNRFSAIDEWFV